MQAEVTKSVVEKIISVESLSLRARAAPREPFFAAFLSAKESAANTAISDPEKRPWTKIPRATPSQLFTAPSLRLKVIFKDFIQQVRHRDNSNGLFLRVH